MSPQGGWVVLWASESPLTRHTENGLGVGGISINQTHPTAEVGSRSLRFGTPTHFPDRKTEVQAGQKHVTGHGLGS